MDFLEDLFDRGDRNRRNSGGFFQNQGHHDDDHDDHHDDDHHHQNPVNSSPQFPGSPVAFLPGGACRKCSTLTVQGAKFCHGCGAAIQVNQNCASCGSTLPPNAVFCAQCGSKNG
jgi:RNA polymerase subunit RPABC4/transcription elongation factor Spt4